MYNKLHTTPQVTRKIVHAMNVIIPPGTLYIEMYFEEVYCSQYQMLTGKSSYSETKSLWITHLKQTLSGMELIEVEAKPIALWSSTSLVLYAI